MLLPRNALLYFCHNIKHPVHAMYLHAGCRLALGLRTCANKIQTHRHAMQSDKEVLTTNMGAPIDDNTNSLTAGTRGPVLLEDYRLTEVRLLLSALQGQVGMCFAVHDKPRSRAGVVRKRTCG